MEPAWSRSWGMNNTDVSGDRRNLCQAKAKDKGSGLHGSAQHEDLNQSTLIDCPFLCRSRDSGGMCDMISGLKEYQLESESGSGGVVLPQIRFPR